VIHRTKNKVKHNEKEIRTAYPNGHFYSPVVDPKEILSNAPNIWPAEIPQILGIDFNDSNHEVILKQWFPEHISKYNYPELGDEDCDDRQFYTQNSQFSWLDARTLFVFLNKIKPARMVEVGSGWSSLLTADVNQRYLGGSCQFQCIEPFPRDFLKDGVVGLSELIVQKVQDTPLSVFEKLEEGDILFIDSSHVCKTGSDVNFLYFEVLPRLKPGVIIHVHDIFLPDEYLRDWVIGENRSWNEQYLLRALLMYSKSFEVLFGCKYAYRKFPELVTRALALESGMGFGGGSFWFRRI
jgi:hypothetical protein